MKLGFLLSAVAVLLAGCTSYGQLEKNFEPTNKDETIFVLGLKPNNYRLTVSPGDIDKGRFHQSIYRNAAFYGSAKDGYAIGKASPGDVIAVTGVQIVKGSDSIFGPVFTPCGETKTVVFAVPKGAVVYLGDLQYSFADKRVNVRYRNDIEAARAFVDTNFPALRGQLQQATVQMMPMTPVGRC